MEMTPVGREESASKNTQSVFSFLGTRPSHSDSHSGSNYRVDHTPSQVERRLGTWRQAVMKRVQDGCEGVTLCDASEG